MKIRKDLLVSPEANQFYGTAAIAASVVVFAYSSLMGSVSILIFYLLWLGLVGVSYREALGSYSRLIWIYGFAGLCALSVFWSEAPVVSARSATQYLSQMVCALIAMRVVKFSTLSRGIVVGCALVLSYSLSTNGYDYDPFSGTGSFVGAFSSKNQVGLYSSIGLYFSYAMLAFYRPGLLFAILSMFTAAIAVYCLSISDSATAMLTAALVVLWSVAWQVLLRFPPRARLPILCFVALAAMVLFLLIGATDAAAPVLALFGKDVTLTGRTYLWQQGIEEAFRHPLLGVGYQAYWVQGFSEAERLWSEFGIGSRNGFHFHNTYVECLVENGVVGVFLLAILFLVTLAVHLKRTLVSSAYNDPIVASGVILMLLVRSFVEVDVIFPYQIGSFLLYFMAGAATLKIADNRMASQSPSGLGGECERLTF